MGKINLLIGFILLLNLDLFSQSDDSTALHYHFIDSFPQDALVYSNDTLLGATPLRIPVTVETSNRIYNIRIFKSGYLEFTFTSNSQDGVINKTVFLTPDGNFLKSDKLVSLNKDYFFKPDRKLIPIICSSFISAGSVALTIYYKNIANEKYDEYLNTGDRTKLDETHKYDLLSGLSLAAFQIGFTGLIYFLFID